MAKSRNIDISRLAFAMQRSRLAMRYQREIRREAVRQMVGKNYSEEGTREQVPVNLIDDYVQIVGRNLVPKNPRVMLSTFHRGAKPTVAIAEAWANKQIEKIKFANTMRRVVTDALFGVGICKVALAGVTDSALTAWKQRAGDPGAWRVDLDDFVYDIHARDFEEVSFIGHRFRAPLEVVREDKTLSKERKELAASYDPAYNLEGDERISMLGRTYYGIDSEEFEDFVDLWEVYLPRHRLVLTLADDMLTGAAPSRTDRAGGDALREQKWLGPETGPYHLLGYGIVPGNAMPKGPIQNLMPLHMFGNETWRKLMRQTQRMKQNTFVQGGANEDGSRILTANDGDMLKVDNPDRIKVVDTNPGPNQALMGMFMQTHEIWNKQAGNLDLLGGAAPQSRTLGQDKMLEQNASGQVSDMQDRTINYVADVMHSLLWYWWHDPHKTMAVTHSLPNMPQIQIRRQAPPHERQRLNFEDVDMRIDPYSMQHQTPQQRFASLQTIVQTIVIPMMQLAVQQGITLDLNKYLELAGDFLDQPDLAEILTIIQPPEQSPQSGRQGPAKPASTTRSYERHSTGAASTYGRQMGVLNTLQNGATRGNGQTGTGSSGR